MKVSNQKPTVVTPIYKTSITGDYNPQEHAMNSIIKPLRNPIIPNIPVTINHDGKDVDDDTLLKLILEAHGETFNATAEQNVKDLYNSTLLYFYKDTPLAATELFITQAATQENLPYPSDRVIYLPATDVIPTSREYLAGKCTFEKWFASLALYARPETLGFYFVSSLAFADFKTYLDTRVNQIKSNLDINTNILFSEFQKLTLNDLTESLLLRKDDDDGNEEYSFQRILISCLMDYSYLANPTECGVLPFSTSELFHPKTVVFVNIEKHAKASAKQIKEEWEIINESIQSPVKIITKNSLAQLTQVKRNLVKAQKQAINYAQNPQGDIAKTASIKFRKSPPTSIDITKAVKKILDKMTFVNKSQNIFKSTKPSFSRANRRDPLDYNRQGKITSIKYKPDLHIYLDTSGSISESNYQDAIKSCIKLAKKLNINLYFNSFSNVLSECTKVNLKDKSTAQIYANFQKIQKVTGGTDFEQIWKYINKSRKRTRELSLLITDFEYSARNYYVKHPKNLYYAPCSNMDWKRIVSSAEYFCKSMKRNDRLCRKKILM